MIGYVVLALPIIFVAIVFILISKNSKLASENKKLKEILEIKNTTIANFEASRVAVKDVIENLSSHDEVMRRLNAGEGREEVSKALGIPINRIELILKFDKIKKEHDR